MGGCFSRSPPIDYENEEGMFMMLLSRHSFLWFAIEAVVYEGKIEEGWEAWYINTHQGTLSDVYFSPFSPNGNGDSHEARSGSRNDDNLFHRSNLPYALGDS